MSLQRLVLVLNASYEAIQICSAKRALTMVLGGKAVVEQSSNHFVKTSRVNIQIPSVIRLLSYRRIPRQNRSISRKGIILRDRNACQYCGKYLAGKDLTIDHVIPKSRGGSTTWLNAVSCCFPCNNRKGSKTPEEANMPLLRKPTQLSPHTKYRLLTSESDYDSWSKFLFC